MGRTGKGIFDLLEVYLPTFIFLILTLSVFIEVLFRYVFDNPIAELFELSIYSFVWAIYLGAALAKRYNQHIRFDLLYMKFSEKGRFLIDIFFDTLTNVIFLILLGPSIQYTLMNYHIKASALRIPWTYLLVCFPLFVLLILIHNTLAILMNLRGLLGKEVRREEKLPWQ
jgi:TRAP-type C4-dicarboxylate transport system permease small subunit